MIEETERARDYIAYASWYCEGCGYGVASFSMSAPPPDRFCAVCGFLNEHHPADELMEMRRRCEPGGWESERQRRREQRINAP